MMRDPSEADMDTSKPVGSANAKTFPTIKRPTLYDRVGGEERLRELVETFYDIVEFEP